MKKILLIVLLFSSILNADQKAESFYEGVKKYVAFKEGSREKVDRRTFMAFSKLDGFLDFYMSYDIYNRVIAIRTEGDTIGKYEKSDPYFRKKICLEDISAYQLAKTLINLVDKDPTLLKSETEMMSMLLIEYTCKKRN